MDQMPGIRIVLIWVAAVEPQIIGVGNATMNALFCAAPGGACAELNALMTIDFFDTDDLSGPVSVTPTVNNIEQLWARHLPFGGMQKHFSTRATLRFIA